MSVLAVDPGIRHCGVAVFSDEGTLLIADLVKNTCKRGGRAHEAAEMALAVYRWFIDRRVFGPPPKLVVEWMQVYATRIRDGSMEGKDPNDLLPLAGVVSALAAVFYEREPTIEPAKSYLPREWKGGDRKVGQMTKEATHERGRSRLKGDELLVWQRAAQDHGDLAHNVLDAVCIGLSHLGRLEARRVLPGAV